MSTVDAPPIKETGTNSVPGETCPRCHTTEAWGESSWCPQCGYYPAVDGAGGAASWADDLPEAPVQEYVDPNQSALESIPMWFWGMLAGVVGIIILSVGIRVMHPDEDSPRGIIALVQLSLGFISVLVSHGIASKYALANDRRLNFNDILLSWFNIWQPTIQRLPETCRQVYAISWGGMAMLTAVTIVGGIDYSAPFRVHEQPDVKPMKLIGKVAAAAKASAGNQKPESMEEALSDLTEEMNSIEEATGEDGTPKSMEEALNELGNMDEKLDGLKDLDIDLEDEELLPTYTMNAWIYGVETDSRNVPQAFLFAANTQGKDQHVARIETATLPRKEFRSIAVQLYTAIQREPEIPSDLSAVWVKPIVSCRMAFKGFTEDGEFREPEFEARVIHQRATYRDQQSQLKLKE